MKRDLPVTYCTKCGGVGHNVRVVGGRCCKIIDGQRCEGLNAAATEKRDWQECTLCETTGYYRNKECPDCKGSGYLFAGLKNTAAV